MDCCPKPTSLTEIPESDCGVNLKQIQRVAIQRTGNQFGTNALPANSIFELADWQTLKAVTDDTKIVITPLVGGNPTIEPGEAITQEPGLNGVEEVVGISPSKFSCEFKELSSEIEKVMKALLCEKNLTVYLFLEGGRIACVEIDIDNQKGFSIQSAFISDRGNQGFATKDTHIFSFSLAPGWSENLIIVKPNFNPLTEI